MSPIPAGAAAVPVLLLALIIAAGCIAGQHPIPPVTPTVQDTARPATEQASGDQGSVPIAEANNRFGTDLYRALAADPKNENKNIFYSPFSITSALSLTAEGAKGTTKDEILAVFHLPADDTARRTGFSGLNAAINSGSSGSSLRTANALWAEKTYPFLPAYTGTARDYYSANVTNLDFIRDPEGSRATINQWVADKTNDKIRDLVPAGSIDPLTRLVITNAVYFKGMWARPFDANATQDAEFHAPAGTVTVKMMQDTGTRAKYAYAETADLQYVELPYAQGSSGSLSMIILLPKGRSLGPAEAALAGANLSALQQSAETRRILLYLPKFSVETEYRLPGTLSRMGMPTAFSSGAADFSGMDGTKNLFISDVIHKAYIDVNAEGTEAAAATAVVMKFGAAMPEENPPVFRADHPFLFAIQDKNTGAILFMGRVENPKGA